MYYFINVSFKVIMQVMSQGQTGNLIFVCTHTTQTRIKGAWYLKVILQEKTGGQSHFCTIVSL